MKKAVQLFIVLMFLSLIPVYSQIIDDNKDEHKFDPSKNPFMDLKETVLQANQNGKRILLDIGGEWCIWCHRLDAFIEQHTEIKDFLQEYFVVLKINYSPENKNEKFLEQYPKVAGYPHIFILEKDGKLLVSKNTGELEKEKSYDADKILTFLKEWAPAKPKS
jgi:thioredoxin-related protein